MAVQVGQPAPDFTLKGVVDGEFVDVKLERLPRQVRGVVLLPAGLHVRLPDGDHRLQRPPRRVREALNAKVVGASVDSEHSHKAWIERDFGSLPFPLLSDIRREAADAYGVLRPDGIALRGTFIVDPEGTLKYAVVHDNNIGRNTDETLRVLAGAPDRRALPDRLAARPGDAELDPI